MVLGGEADLGDRPVVHLSSGSPAWSPPTLLRSLRKVRTVAGDPCVTALLTAQGRGPGMSHPAGWRTGRRQGGRPSGRSRELCARGELRGRAATLSPAPRTRAPRAPLRRPRPSGQDPPAEDSAGVGGRAWGRGAGEAPELGPRGGHQEDRPPRALWPSGTQAQEQPRGKGRACWPSLPG